MSHCIPWAVMGRQLSFIIPLGPEIIATAHLDDLTDHENSRLPVQSDDGGRRTTVRTALEGSVLMTGCCGANAVPWSRNQDDHDERKLQYPRAPLCCGLRFGVVACVAHHQCYTNRRSACCGRCTSMELPYAN